MLKLLERVVEKFLEDNPAMRGSDDLLYVAVAEQLGVDLDGTSARDFLLHYRTCLVPTVETVGRCRRRIQAKRPELKPTKEIELKRRRCEQSFYEYSQK